MQVVVGKSGKSSGSAFPDLKLPESPKPKRKESHSLTIALAVAAAFMISAIGVAAWLFVQKGGQAVITQIDPNSTTNVTSVNWAQPALPEGFVAYGQSTADVAATYYADVSEGCQVNTRIFQPVDDQLADVQAAAVKAQDSQGATSTSGEEAKAITIKDADDERQYDFAGVQFDQTLSSPTRSFDAQTGAVFYKQFGHKIATISYACKLATAEVNAEDLLAFVTQFTVKTER